MILRIVVIFLCYDFRIFPWNWVLKELWFDDFFFVISGENGFNQAIELAAESLANVKFIQEKKLINSYFDQISQDTGKYCFGVEDTLRALEMGAVETLICWENLDIQRYSLKNHTSGNFNIFLILSWKFIFFFFSFIGEQKILHLTTEQEKDKTHFTDKETGVELELEESMPFLEWLANNYKSFGATLEIITDRSQEGSQFVRGFGGIGGMLRYKVDFQAMQCDDFGDEDFDLDDY